MPDPKIRKDGLCAREGCKEELPKPDDPFCSSRCCRVYHGCVDSVGDEEHERRSSAGRKGRDKSRRLVAA
jgi:hypothetical protein